ncbi:hypothetical protein SPBRAN_519 [uncultured Candidatus Thioglobus sp.]|nr:hypothetical protein SPBRAN_519 [uncultured Candidatus Thioglobus sp.]
MLNHEICFQSNAVKMENVKYMIASIFSFYKADFKNFQEFRGFK